MTALRCHWIKTCIASLPLLTWDLTMYVVRSQLRPFYLVTKSLHQYKPQLGRCHDLSKCGGENLSKCGGENRTPCSCQASNTSPLLSAMSGFTTLLRRTGSSHAECVATARYVVTFWPRWQTRCTRGGKRRVELCLQRTALYLWTERTVLHDSRYCDWGVGGAGEWETGAICGKVIRPKMRNGCLCVHTADAQDIWHQFPAVSRLLAQCLQSLQSERS